MSAGSKWPSCWTRAGSSDWAGPLQRLSCCLGHGRLRAKGGRDVALLSARTTAGSTPSRSGRWSRSRTWTTELVTVPGRDAGVVHASSPSSTWQWPTCSSRSVIRGFPRPRHLGARHRRRPSQSSGPRPRRARARPGFRPGLGPRPGPAREPEIPVRQHASERRGGAWPRRRGQRRPAGSRTLTGRPQSGANQF